jgi:hypothetical protein
MRRLVLALAVTSSAVLAADPPSLVNYQGVLRDALDKPRTGTFDMSSASTTRPLRGPRSSSMRTPAAAEAP